MSQNDGFDIFYTVVATVVGVLLVQFVTVITMWSFIDEIVAKVAK